MIASLIKRLLPAVALCLSAAVASAAPVSFGSSFTLGGQFTFVPPLQTGSVLNPGDVDELIVGKTGDFSSIIDGSVDANGAANFTLSAGSANDGLDFFVDSLDFGVFTFVLRETLFASADTLPSGLAQFDAWGDVDIHNDNFDITGGQFVINGTANNFSGIGTYSLTILATDQPQPIPVPASLPLAAGGFALLGFLGRRRARKTGAGDHAAL